MLKTGLEQYAAYVKMGRIYDDQILLNLSALKALVTSKISIIEPTTVLNN